MYCPWLFQYLALIYRAILPKHILFYFFSLVWLAYLRYQPHKFHLLTPSGAASYNECRCRPHAYILYGVVAVRVRCTSSLAALLGSKYLGWQPSVKRAQVAKYASSISHNWDTSANAGDLETVQASEFPHSHSLPGMSRYVLFTHTHSRCRIVFAYICDLMWILDAKPISWASVHLLFNLISCFPCWHTLGNSHTRRIVSKAER